ncbi:MAG TPA: transketolase C-terminal domain-containing protein, partial [Bacteroidales bacterium]|nr:transketolase C-terminal domain-containing protein [Bacteroidales bacterium]
CNIYSSFAQRAYDQIVHDVAIQNLHVVFCLDRAGLVGNDGATHHGAYDIAFLRCVPNLVIASPIDELELRNMLYTAQLSKNSFPMVIRYPRGRGVHSEWKKEFEEIAIGKAVQLSQGTQIAILSIGPVGIKVKAACEKLRKNDISVAHYNMRFVKPLDSECMHQICSDFDCILTVEDGCLQGGFGSAILEFVSENNYSIKTKRLGIPDKFVEHGSQQELIQECGFDIESIVNETLKLLK